MRIYVDIDGTLTDDPENKWGNIIISRVKKVKEFIDEGHEVVIWSGNGTDYANEFCKFLDIKPYVAVGKPDIYIDDRVDIRSPGKLNFESPEYLNGE